jgi:hypothetical protein
MFAGATPKFEINNHFIDPLRVMAIPRGYDMHKH